MQTILIPIFGTPHCIPITLDEGSGSISSDLKDCEEDDGESEAYDAAIDGLESLILAHACAGIDVTSAAYAEGITTAVDAIANNLG